MPKNKKTKKIGWWRWIGRAFGLPLLGIGRDASIEFIEDKPVQELALFSIEITEDILNIYTDLNEENKQQMKSLLEDKDERAILLAMNLLAFLIPKILEKIGKGEKTTLEESKLLRVYKAIEAK
jgi:hypothetical protein